MPVSLPRFIKKAFATDGLKTAIPDASDNVTGRAGYDQGFPPINMQPQEAGGIPPNGTDMNGVIYDVTLAISYIQSGKFFPFNQDFANAIGGYGVGAIVSDASSSALWVNNVASNTSSPSVANGWTNFVLGSPTETTMGTPFTATTAEVNAGAIDGKMVSPQKLLGGFAYYFTQGGGFIRLPRWMLGFTVQWGERQIVPGTGSNSVTPITFPIAFPNECLTVNTTLSNSPVAGPVNVSSEIFLKTGYSVVSSGFYPSPISIPVRFIAFGY